MATSASMLYFSARSRKVWTRRRAGCHWGRNIGLRLGRHIRCRRRRHDAHVALRERQLDSVLVERLQNLAVERALEIELTLLRIGDPHAQFEHDAVVAKA